MASKTKRRQRRRRSRKQRGGVCPCVLQQGGDWSAFWNRPWVSTVPENDFQRIGTHWYGEPRIPPLTPTYPTYTLLSNYDPLMQNYGKFGSSGSS